MVEFGKVVKRSFASLISLLLAAAFFILVFGYPIGFNFFVMLFGLFFIVFPSVISEFFFVFSFPFKMRFETLPEAFGKKAANWIVRFWGAAFFLWGLNASFPSVEMFNAVALISQILVVLFIIFVAFALVKLLRHGPPKAL